MCNLVHIDQGSVHVHVFVCPHTGARNHLDSSIDEGDLPRKWCQYE